MSVSQELKAWVLSSLNINSETMLFQLWEVLQGLGVETIEDMQLVKEADLENSGLKTIQKRKLLQSPKSKVSEATEKETKDDVASVPEPVIAVLQTRSNFLQEANIVTPAIREEKSWEDDYVVKISIFPKKIKEILLGKKKLPPKERRELVRFLIADILKVTGRPVKKELAVVARKFVGLYPSTLQDTIEGEVLGNGYEHLLMQLVARVENQLRGIENEPVRLRKNTQGSSILAKRRVDKNNCPGFEPPIPITEDNKQRLENLQKELIALRDEGQPDMICVKEKMMSTYALQRHCIISGMETKCLKDDWPFLFEEVGITVHIELLLGKNIIHTVEEFFEQNTQKILNFFSLVSTNARRLKLLQQLKSHPSGAQMEAATLVLLAMDHFHESPLLLFPSFEPGTSIVDIQQDLPPHPCLISIGGDLFHQEYLMLAVDKCVVNQYISSTKLISALGMLLGLYFTLNVQYPKEAGATLEFLQRCIAKLNLEERNGPKRKKYVINPKVLTFINKLSQFEWTDINDLELEDHV